MSGEDSGHGDEGSYAGFTGVDFGPETDPTAEETHAETHSYSDPFGGGRSDAQIASDVAASNGFGSAVQAMHGVLGPEAVAAAIASNGLSADVAPPPGRPMSLDPMGPNGVLAFAPGLVNAIYDDEEPEPEKGPGFNFGTMGFNVNPGKGKVTHDTDRGIGAMIGAGLGFASPIPGGSFLGGQFGGWLGDKMGNTQPSTIASFDPVSFSPDQPGYGAAYADGGLLQRNQPHQAPQPQPTIMGEPIESITPLLPQYSYNYNSWGPNGFVPAPISLLS